MCQDKFWLDKYHHNAWHLLEIVPGTYIKFGPNRVSNSWDISVMDKCRQDYCCQDKCHCDKWNQVLYIPKNLPLKFHQNRVSNSWDIADSEFVWGGVWRGGMQSQGNIRKKERKYRIYIPYSLFLWAFCLPAPSIIKYPQISEFTNCANVIHEWPQSAFENVWKTFDDICLCCRRPQLMTAR